MYGSTGSAQDVSGFQTFTFEEIKAAANGPGRLQAAMRKTLAVCIQPLTN